MANLNAVGKKSEIEKIGKSKSRSLHKTYVKKFHKPAGWKTLIA